MREADAATAGLIARLDRPPDWSRQINQFKTRPPDDLAPDLPEARLAMAYYHYWGFRDYDAALAELDAITERRNADSTVLAARGYILRRQGRYDESAAALRLALDLSPLDGVLAVELANTQYYGWALVNRDWLLPSAEQLRLRGKDRLDRVAERLGIGPEDCWAANPRLVYGRMTGWGQDGPWADRAGHDTNYIALAGALHGLLNKVMFLFVIAGAAFLAERTRIGSHLTGAVIAILAAGLVSLVASVQFLILAAPDVAMTEAAIGSGLTTFLFFFVLGRVRRGEHD